MLKIQNISFSIEGKPIFENASAIIPTGHKIGIVGRNGGATAQFADACVVVPTVNTRLITPLSESFQAIIWHLIVSHPDIQLENTKW